MWKSISSFKTVEYALISLFFVVCFLTFLKVDLWDYDFWWHIATGRYIVETGSLPDKDPFSYTSTLEENKNQFPEREDFILKQYWLSQIFFYFIYEHTGVKGIIFLRSLLLTLTLVVVFWRLLKWSVSFPVSFIFLFTLFSLLTNATGERPVLFTILFTGIVFFILENFRDNRDKKIFLLIPLMLLWANMHGGFIVGVIIITVYIFGEGVKKVIGRSKYTKKESVLFYAAAVLALLASFANPMGWRALTIAFSPKYKPFTQGIQEYASPFFLYTEKIVPVNYWYIFMAVLFPIVLIVRNKKIDGIHIVLLSGFFIMSVSAIRFIEYYIIIAAMILGRESDVMIRGLLRKRFSSNAHEKILAGLTVFALFSLLLFAFGVYKSKQFTFDIAKGYSVPVKAVDFIEENHLSGNMLNDYGYGGYLTWRLYPKYKTFIDSRGLNIAVMTEFQWITGTVGYENFSGEVDSSITKIPLWERLADHYDINFMLLSIFDIFTQIPPVIFQLVESDKWVPIYCDYISVIFVRNTELNSDIIKKHTIPKEVVYNTIIFRGATHALFNKVNPRSLIAIGDIFFKMGRLKDALTAYQYALNRMPTNPAIQEKVTKIEAEITSKSK